MSANAKIASEAPLFNYTLASADMRYIEIGERLFICASIRTVAW